MGAHHAWSLDGFRDLVLRAQSPQAQPLSADLSPMEQKGVQRAATRSDADSLPQGRRSGDRGAALVEFGIVAPMLLLLLFGVVEFGLLFGQKLDVSQGAREGARLVSVNFQDTAGTTGATQSTEIVSMACSRMEVASSATITIDVSAGTAVGDIATFTVESTAQPVTGVFDPWLSNRVLNSVVDVRLEQAATFANTLREACP
jgi:Flp pilus assembly protein TadG